MSEKLDPEFGSSNSNAIDDDPLAELARIVAGEPEPEHVDVPASSAPDSFGQAEVDAGKHLDSAPGTDSSHAKNTDADAEDELDRALADALGAEFPSDINAELDDGQGEEIPAEAQDISDAIADLDVEPLAPNENAGEPSPVTSSPQGSQFEDDLINALRGELVSPEASEPVGAAENHSEPVQETAAEAADSAFEADLTSFEAALSAELDAAPPSSERPGEGDWNEETATSGQAFADAFNHEFEQIRSESSEELSATPDTVAEEPPFPEPIVPQSVEPSAFQQDPIGQADNFSQVEPEFEQPAQPVDTIDDLDFGSAFAEELGVEKVEEFSGWSNDDNQLAADQFAEQAGSYQEAVQAGGDPGYLAGVDGFENQDEVFHDEEQEDQGSGSKKYAIAALVIALFGGFIVAGYGFLGGADGTGANGEPKLIRADTEPVKVKPDDPGGKVVANQDKASYERVAGEESEPVSQETLISNTEEPANIDAGTSQSGILAEKTTDRLNATEGENETLSQAQNGSVQPRVVQTVTVRPDGTIVQGTQATPVISQLVQETTNAASARVADAQVQLSEALKTTVKPVEATVIKPQEPIDGAVSRGDTGIPVESPLPKPIGQSLVPSSDPVSAVNTPEPVELAAIEPTVTQPAGVQRSEWVVQVSSQRSAEAAQSSYQNLSNRFSVLKGRPMSIQRANVNGDTFYRVRMQTASKADANQLCSSLKAAGGSCFVTR